MCATVIGVVVVMLGSLSRVLRLRVVGFGLRLVTTLVSRVCFTTAAFVLFSFRNAAKKTLGIVNNSSVGPVRDVACV